MELGKQDGSGIQETPTAVWPVFEPAEQNAMLFS
jgi:hypothetical protein